jgi:hypothetical protein
MSLDYIIPLLLTLLANIDVKSLWINYLSLDILTEYLCKILGHIYTTCILNVYIKNV